jgi:DNA-directed RNA polymerase specialized sigma subunit
MNVKDYLCRYHDTEQKIMRMQAEVNEYIRLANSIPGMNFDAIRVDGTKSLEAPFVKWINRALENELLIADMRRNLPIIKGEIISLISELEDEQHKMVMIHRYIDWLSWNEIAAKMFVSYSSTRRLHGKAIALIKLPGQVESAAKN